MDHSQKIMESWEANAESWIKTIDNADLESRTLVTNDAIINSILNYKPHKILDVGCGEGWLTRTLRANGVEAYGVDAISSLVKYAVEKDGAYYFHYSYDDIAAGKYTLPSPFDAIVINFALIDKDSTDNLVRHLPSLLKKDGLLFIQTLHPLSVAANDNYVSGWKEGSWNGMKQDFVLAYEWYFRTMADWMQLFLDSGFILQELKEPVHPVTKRPLSVIFILRTK